MAVRASNAATLLIAASIISGACGTEKASSSSPATPSTPLAAGEAGSDLRCSIEMNLRSRDAGPAVDLHVTNATPSEVRLLWIDLAGARKPYATIAPSGVLTQRTFAGHAWVATDRFGRCLALSVPEVGDSGELRVTTVLPPPPSQLPSAARSPLSPLSSLPPSALPPPPTALGLSPFYAKYIDAGGIPIVSSPRVSDRALFVARDLVDRMLRKRPDARARIAAAHIRVAVMSPDEQTLDIPEHADLAGLPTDTGVDWNKRARGLGATLVRPATSCGEENLLCFEHDRYRGENILIHEFGHTIHEIGVAPGDPTFQPALDAALASAKANGRFKGTYALTNASEYWAEGVQDWFDTNLTSPPQHNEIHTRAQLKTYDPALYALLGRVFEDDAWRYHCPSD